jgi:tether containing UBX domain for GLUT4
MDNGGGSGQLYFETPVLRIESRTFFSFLDFQKTLSQLGYNSNSVLIRLSFQKTDRTLADAMSDISEYFQEEGTVKAENKITDAVAETALPTIQPPVVEKSTAQPDSTSPDPSTTKTTQQEPVTSETDLMDIDAPPTDPLTPVSIFSAPSNSIPAAAQTTEPDEIYMPGIQHAQLHQHRLKTAGQNKRLLSDEEIEEKAAAEAAKIAAIKSIDIRVRFPDNTSAQWCMGPDAAGETLYAAVRQVMADDRMLFKLILPGSKGTILDDRSKLIKGHGLDGRTLVTLYWDDSVPVEARKQSFLKQSVANRAEEVVIPEIRHVEPEEEPAPGPSVRKTTEKPKSEGDVTKKLSKFLRLGKK